MVDAKPIRASSTPGRASPSSMGSWVAGFAKRVRSWGPRGSVAREMDTSFSDVAVMLIGVCTGGLVAVADLLDADEDPRRRRLSGFGGPGVAARSRWVLDRVQSVWCCLPVVSSFHRGQLPCAWGSGINSVRTVSRWRGS